MALFKKRRKPDPDDLYGTGLWRQHRDRFNRAVDRFYTTAVALHSEMPDSPCAEILAQQTVRLNELSAAIDQAAQSAHAAHPADGMVIPADTREAVGRLPELLSHAALKVAEAAQAASMTRAALKMAGTTSPAAATPPAGSPAGPAGEEPVGEEPGMAAAASAAQYVDDACHIVAACTEAARDL